MGENEECAYTWDMQLNTNLNFSRDGFLPRCRFDRLYFRPATSSTVKFKPVCFKLEGLEMIPSIHRFCSDHWAIQVEFEL
jgi:tyrosyl-DNA phosphodiesterase 2